MKFKLNKELFDLLTKNVPETNEYIYDIQNNHFTSFIVDENDVLEVQLLINDEIVLNGMDNQDNVNALGIKLYQLYDEILYQKNNQ